MFIQIIPWSIVLFILKGRKSWYPKSIINLVLCDRKANRLGHAYFTSLPDMCYLKWLHFVPGRYNFCFCGKASVGKCYHSWFSVFRCDNKIQGSCITTKCLDVLRGFTKDNIFKSWFSKNHAQNLTWKPNWGQ